MPDKSNPEVQLPALEPEKAPEALEAVDQVVRLYAGGLRKVHRKIFPALDVSNIDIPENIAEHSWSVEMAVRSLWENREEVGIDFGRNFDIGLAVAAAGIHDVGETIAGDLDGMSENEELLSQKQSLEINGFKEIGKANKYLAWMVELGIEAEQKERPEFKFTSDVDKFVPMRLIVMFAQHRWWGKGGEITTREKHTRITRRKLSTPFGHTLFDEVERDLDLREALHQADDRLPLFPPTEATASMVNTNLD